MNVALDLADPTPPYEQLRRQLASAIELGDLTSGSRLPPVRQLAGDLGIATGTVARAYTELESAGLVVARRGGGTRVADGVTARGTGRLETAARAYAQVAASLGFDLRTASAALQHVWPD